MSDPWGDAARVWWLRFTGSFELLDNARRNALRRWLPKRSPTNACCLNGQVCVVTGANAGVGLATVQALADRGCHVIMACRSLQRGAVAAEEVEAAQQSLPGCSPGRVEVAELDLNSLASVRRFVARFAARRLALSLLVCNAGIMGGPRRTTTDGLEMQFQGNYLGHWLLATELLALQELQREERSQAVLRRRRYSAANSNQSDKPAVSRTRVLMVSSMTHRGGRLDFSDLQAKRRYDALGQYAATKLACIVAAKEMQRRFDRDGSGNTAVAVDPGVVDTELARKYLVGELDLLPSLLRPLVRPLWQAAVPWLMLPAQTAAETMLYAATAPAEQVAGKFIKHDRPCKAARAADDERIAALLWDVSRELTQQQTESAASEAEASARC